MEEIVIKKVPLKPKKMMLEQTPTAMGITTEGDWTVPKISKEAKKKNKKKFKL
jgi:hypothetical protein